MASKRQFFFEKIKIAKRLRAWSPADLNGPRRFGSPPPDQSVIHLGAQSAAKSEKFFEQKIFNFGFKPLTYRNPSLRGCL